MSIDQRVQGKASWHWFYMRLLWIVALLTSLPTLAAAQSLTLNKPSYAPGEQIVLEFKAFPGNAQDWITVVKSDAPTDTWGQWYYTAGKKEGSFTFNGLPAGTYQARGYFDWPKGGTAVRAQVAISVAPAGAGPATVGSGAASLVASSSKYAPDEAIRITYKGFPGSAQDWITIVPRGAPQSEYAEWYYTGGKSSGEFSFKGLAPGDYEARAFFDWPNGGYQIRVRAPFKVDGEVKLGGVWLRTSKPVYLTDEPIDVSYGGFPNPGRDWLTVVSESTPKDSYAEWSYTESGAGRRRFEGLPPGTYQVRGYFDWPNGAYDVKVSRSFSVVDSRKKTKLTGPCSNPKTLALMDRWLAQAQPPESGKANEALRYDSWGRVASTQRKSVAFKWGEGRCMRLWKEAARLRSHNFGTLKEFLKKHE